MVKMWLQTSDYKKIIEYGKTAFNREINANVSKTVALTKKQGIKTTPAKNS
jgi:hypothetical protein